MTVRINTVTVTKVPDGVPLARITEEGIWLWPQGYGQGPCILMDEGDWYRLRDSVEAALAVRRIQHCTEGGAT